MATESGFRRIWRLQKDSRRSQIVKALQCTNCKKEFQLVGQSGFTNEVSQRAGCPYCQFPNDVVWPIGIPFEVRKNPSV